MAGGDDVAVFLRHAHAGELLRVHRGGLGGIVGQEPGRAPGAPQGLQEIQRAVNQPVAQVEGAVHVQQKAADGGQQGPDFLVRHGVILLTPSGSWFSACEYANRGFVHYITAAGKKKGLIRLPCKIPCRATIHPS